MNKYLFLSFLLSILLLFPVKSQHPERGTILPISAQNTADLEFGFNGTAYLTANYDHMFFLKRERFGPALLLRAGIGDGIAPGYGMILLGEVAYTTGYLTFVELGAGYNAFPFAGQWEHLPYFQAAFRHRANAGYSLRLYSRLIMNQSEEVPLFGLGVSLGFTF
jgi:hypothetical protein